MHPKVLYLPVPWLCYQAVKPEKGKFKELPWSKQKGGLPKGFLLGLGRVFSHSHNIEPEDNKNHPKACHHPG